MFKKTIDYIDYNGNKRSEDFYFNLTKAECLTLEMSTSGGMTALIQQLVAAQDLPTLLDLFTKIVNKAYGEKSLDGRRFVKSQEVTDAFIQTEAFSDFFVEISTNTEAATKFINGIIPKGEDNNIIPPGSITENNIVPMQPGTVQ